MEKQSKPGAEEVTLLPLSELRPFTDYPFTVREDDAMKEAVESIREYGVVTPAIVRPDAEGGYEIISGHRRKRACELAGLDAIPAIIREMDDNLATIIMVDSNLQREDILPSERARAYKMKLDALKRQGARTDLTSPQVAAKFRSDDEVARGEKISGDTVRRYIRLTELSPPLLQMVDDHKIAFTPAVELSYLKPEEQALLVETIESEQATPSLSQAQRMKRLSQAGELNEDTILSVMLEEKKPETYDITISGEKLRRYFPRSYTPRQMEDTIVKLLETWHRKRMQSLER